MPDFSPPDMSSITSAIEPTPPTPPVVVTQTIITSTTHTSSSVESYPIATTSYRRRPPQPQLVPDDSTTTIPRHSPSGEPVPYAPYSPYHPDAALEADASMSSEMALDPAGIEQHTEGEANTSHELGEMEQYVRLSSPDVEPEPGPSTHHAQSQPPISEPQSQHLAVPVVEDVASSEMAVDQVSQEISMNTELPTSTLPAEQQRAMEQAEAFAASLVLSSMAIPSSSPYGAQYPPPTLSFSSQESPQHPPSTLSFSFQPRQAHSQAFAHTQAPLPDTESFAHTQAPISDTQAFAHTQAPIPDIEASIPDLQPSSPPRPASQQSHSTQSIDEVDESQDDIRPPEVGAGTQMLFSAVADFLGPAAPAVSTALDPASEPAAEPELKEEPQTQSLPQPVEQPHQTEPSAIRPMTPPRAPSSQPDKPVSPPAAGFMSRIIQGYQGLTSSLIRSSPGTQSSSGTQGFGLLASQAPVPELQLDGEVHEE
ncbi:hypothetical protein CALVIDRAFT_397808 [Calocera viscosa TUFC12733]|uniref:Uncharacterized protein n=1 Tax=Calocera viscosa (strain TUFC12733) TaxID=1330018 RepID=A0A167PRU2_CALVF|nr:hypothetical protein CALVIDRAFT_397808 [Calocera viscosa TUFC12733]